MRPINPCLLKDFYKVGHKFQYPGDTTLIYSNFTPRGTRRDPKIDGIIAAGFQYLVQEYFINQFNENFFRKPKDEVVGQYERVVRNALGPGTNVDHIAALHDVGWLPLHMKAVPEGTLVPYRVPVLTIRNTLPQFYWLTNMVETLLSNILWLPMTSATTAFEYRKTFAKYAKETGGDLAFVPWQGHDFSFRGMPGIEAACLSAFGHILSFTGTDTIPVIPFVEQYYGANGDIELIAGSVPATEHSVMCIRLKAGEFQLIEHLITEVYPKDIISIVCDTFDFFKVITDYLPRLKAQILARNGKVVIRPDSGDPVKIVCGDPDSTIECERKGAVECLWDVFGGGYTNKGFKTLDPHIGIIYGDSITQERQEAMLMGLKKKGFASTTPVLGIGSYTYQYVTRDTDGWAMKATYAETTTPDGSIEGVPIFKAPKTDNGVKNSAKGLLRVTELSDDYGDRGRIVLEENVSWEQESNSLLKTVFKDGVVYNFQTLKDIRKRIENQL